nr:O-acyltransferase WSD1-like [Ipomoea batatas]
MSTSTTTSSPTRTASMTSSPNSPSRNRSAATSWKFHLLMAHNYAILHLHHSLGDGVAFMSLFLSCCRDVCENEPPFSQSFVFGSCFLLLDHRSFVVFNQNIIGSVMHGVKGIETGQKYNYCWDEECSNKTKAGVGLKKPLEAVAEGPRGVRLEMSLSAPMLTVGVAKLITMGCLILAAPFLTYLDRLEFKSERIKRTSSAITAWTEEAIKKRIKSEIVWKVASILRKMADTVVEFAEVMAEIGNTRTGGGIIKKTFENIAGMINVVSSSQPAP